MNLEERIAKLEAYFGPDDEMVRCFREAYTIQNETEALTERRRKIGRQLCRDSTADPRADPDEPGSAPKS